jgi:aspartate kinase
MKFGGTSVQDAGAIRNVIGIVKSNPERKIVVASAIANATNCLEEIARLAGARRESEAREILENLVNRHHSIINELIRDKRFKGESAERIISYHRKISELVTGVSIVGELTLRTLDAFRVFGELMSSAIIYDAMREEGIDVELVDSGQVIVTNNEFSRAYPDFKATQEKVTSVILPLLEGNRTVLTQGFIGATEDGTPTTMGRESSDFSAAIYGALIDADEVQIWTDVDGVLTADPNVIQSAFKVNEISFVEMEELSNFGAKVLHKNSIKPAMERNIPIRVLNSKNVNSTGTLINSNSNFHNQVKSITYKKNIIVLQLKPKETLGLYVFWEMMLNILVKHKPQVDILVSSNNAIIIVIAENNYTRIHYDDLRHEFEEISECTLIRDKVLITIVGSDLNAIDNFEQRIFISIPNVRAEAVVFGFNRHSFSMLMDVKNFDSVMRNLHREFFEKDFGDGKLFARANNKSHAETQSIGR